MALQSTTNLTTTSHNTTNNTLMIPQCVPLSVSSTFKQSMIVIHAIIFLIGVLGNASAIYLIAIKNKLIKTFDYYIVVLATADLLSAVFNPLVTVHDLLLNHEKWLLLGEVGCKVFVSFDHFTMLVSSTMLVLISAERLRAIRNIKEISTNQRKFISLEISAVLIISLSVVIPYMESLSVRYGICFNWKWTSIEMFTYYAVYISACCFLPMTLMTIIYTKAVYILSNLQNVNERRAVQIKQITKMFVYVVVSFFVATAPYMVVNFIGSYYGTYDIAKYCKNIELFTSLTYGFYTLSHVQCCVNPFIYALMHPSVKRVRNRISSSVRVTTGTIVPIALVNMASRKRTYDVSGVEEREGGVEMVTAGRSNSVYKTFDNISDSDSNSNSS